MANLAEEQENLILAINEEKLHLSDLEREIRRFFNIMFDGWEKWSHCELKHFSL